MFFQYDSEEILQCATNKGVHTNSSRLAALSNGNGHERMLAGKVFATYTKGNTAPIAMASRHDRSRSSENWVRTQKSTQYPIKIPRLMEMSASVTSAPRYLFAVIGVCCNRVSIVM